MFAPHLPFVTEEVWSWFEEGSIHRAPWPVPADVRSLAGDGDALVLTVAGEVLGEVRRAKTEAKTSLRAEVAEAVVRDHGERLAALGRAEGELRSAGRIAALSTEESDEFAVEVVLAEGG